MRKSEIRYQLHELGENIWQRDDYYSAQCITERMGKLHIKCIWEEGIYSIQWHVVTMKNWETILKVKSDVGSNGKT